MCVCEKVCVSVVTQMYMCVCEKSVSLFLLTLGSTLFPAFASASASTKRLITGCSHDRWHLWGFEQRWLAAYGG